MNDAVTNIPAVSCEASRPIRWGALATVCCALGAWAPASHAQFIQPRNIQKIVIDREQPAPAERIEDPAQLLKVFDGLVADLGSNDFAARQRASEKIGANEQFDLAMLETALKRQDLTLEARSRLVAIARQRFFRTPRAALGFKFGGQLRDRVIVGQTFPKFDCAKLLEEGDMIVGADGFKLDGLGAQYLLQCIIISHDPGEMLKLVVRRGAKKLDLNIRLGNFADLDQNAAVFIDDRLPRAWRLRAQTRLNAVAEPIRIESAPASWGPSEEAALRKVDRQMAREANETPIKLVGGGTPRLAQNNDEARAYDPGMAQQIVMIGGQPRVINVPIARGGFGGGGGGGFGADFDPLSRGAPMNTKAEEAQLLKERMDTDKRMAALDPASPELVELAKMRGIITKQMDALQAEIAEAGAARDGKPSAAEASPPPPANP